MKLKKWEIALFVSVLIAVIWGVNTQNQQKQLAEKLIRFHVVADSDDEEDQRIKLEVRDAVLNEVDVLLENVNDRDNAEVILSKNLDAIIKAAKKELKAQGDNNNVSVTLVEESFPTRYYDTFTLPAGNYTSLRVTIGEGKGHNWWCVVFPPICATAAIEDAEIASFTESELELITDDNTETVIKFKTLEMFTKIREWFAVSE